MSYFSLFTANRPDAEIEAAIAAAKSRAVAEFTNQQFQGEYPETGYGIVTIRPRHIQAGGAAWASSHYWGSSMTASNTFEAWINITQTELAFEILCGQWNYEASPTETDIYLVAEGRDYPTINIEEMYSYDVAKVYWKKPVVISPDKTWAYWHKAINTGIQRQGIAGFTLGTRAFIILRA